MRYIFSALALSAFACNNNEPVKEYVPPVEVQDVNHDEELRQSIINFAKEHLGVTYCYAGSTPEQGFDCSGFVYYVYKHFGIELPRSSSGFKNFGEQVKPKDFRVGDILVFYGYRDSDSIGHVGIICEANGMNSKFIHASSGSEYAVTISELGSEMYTRRFYKAVNVLDD
ncbi:C40 family peptidase [Flavobacterium sp. D11R37]|uniref:C40 family peptidase n=1 Tax=Flavobacterium coralii TaxID=2838017 RepID=UPI001CA763C4|nr:C40 family peptidase [Flavobacterium coralii]MBY8961603.1 C40 family peptidase [Flavobacterium coralii]